MKCFRKDCDKGAPQHTLFRVNAKGVPGIFACKDHRIEPDPELDAIIEALELERRVRHVLPILRR